MNARAWNGGPDDHPYGHAPERRGGPLEVCCDQCGHWTMSPVDVGRIWFFCSEDCREAWAVQPRVDIGEARF